MELRSSLDLMHYGKAATIAVLGTMTKVFSEYALVLRKAVEAANSSTAMMFKFVWIRCLLVGIMAMLMISLLLLGITRYRTRRKLERYGFPTVYWTPRFWNYHRHHPQPQHHIPRTSPLTRQPQNEQEPKPIVQQLSASSITNILPRMERLKGPYGMYGTVYGLSTPVVHMAHPLPVRHVLLAPPSGAAGGTSSQQKAPAYNHFKNFCGDGVFTADGEDWKQKRVAVMHALFRRSQQQPNQNFESRVLTLANQSAESLIQQIQDQQHPSSSSSTEKSCSSPSVVVNIVPLLQRTTVNLIYHYITGSDSVHDSSNNGPFDLASSSRPEQQSRKEGSSSHLQQQNHTVNRANCSDDSQFETQNNTLSPQDQNLGLSSSSSSSPTKDTEKTARQKVSTELSSLLSSFCSSSSSLLNDDDNKTMEDAYLNAITQIRMIILAQARSFWFLMPRWCYRMFSSTYQQEEEILQPIRQVAHHACVQAKPHSPLHTLQSIPLYNNHHRHNNPNQRKDRFSAKNNNEPTTTIAVSQNLLHEAITLLFAGQDTTAATLSWTLHLLSLHPQIQQALYQEVHTVINNSHTQQQQENSPQQTNGHNNNNNNNPSGSTSLTLDKKLLSRMPYLDAVIKESMRLYPVAPFIVRKIMQNIPISDSTTRLSSSTATTRQTKTAKKEDRGENQTNKIHQNNGHEKSMGTERQVTLPKGAFACIWIYGLHRNPEFWHRPNDFCPERWLVEEEGGINAQNHQQHPRDRGISEGAFMPFARGPRNCLGQPFAHLVLRTLLSHLVYRFSFEDEQLLMLSKTSSLRTTCHEKQQQNIRNRESIMTSNDLNTDVKSPKNSGGKMHMKEVSAENVADKLRKEMQAGFTVLPQNGVVVKISRR